MNHPRFERFFDGFVTGWLGLKNWRQVQKNAARHPRFSQELLADMVEETRRFMHEQMISGASLSTLLTSRESFLNRRLAQLYGATPASGDVFAKAQLPGSRAGLLNQGSILTVTGGATEPSPVKRGLWVAQKITCSEPPPPPPNVPTLEASAPSARTPKEALAEHRRNPACAGCHANIDPFGLALENYDSLGQWRETYLDGSAIDASSDWNGEPFRGSGQLVGLILRDPNALPTCVGEHLAFYAVANVPDKVDNCFVQAMARRAVGAGAGSFADLVREFVTSELFFKFRVPGGAP